MVGEGEGKSVKPPGPGPGSLRGRGGRLGQWRAQAGRHPPQRPLSAAETASRARRHPLLPGERGAWGGAYDWVTWEGRPPGAPSRRGPGRRARDLGVWCFPPRLLENRFRAGSPRCQGNCRFCKSQPSRPEGMMVIKAPSNPFPGGQRAVTGVCLRTSPRVPGRSPWGCVPAAERPGGAALAAQTPARLRGERLGGSRRDRVLAEVADSGE